MLRRSFLVIASLFACVVSGCGGDANSYSYLTYKEVIFQGPTNANIDRMFTKEVGEIPNLFVKTPAGEVFALKEIPEKIVARLPGARHRKYGFTDEYDLDQTNLGFVNGVLRQGSFGKGPLQLGTRAVGPFRSLPMTSEQVRDLFGKPEREGRAEKSKIKFW